MKRFLSIVICLCLIVPSCTFAEEGGSVFDSIENWFKQAWDNSSAWVSQAWNDSASWVSNAWGDASEWVGQAWNDSSKWVSDIWGDVSAWAVDSYNSVSGTIGTWWNDTFNKTTVIDEAWVSDDAVAQAFNSLQEYLIKYKINTLLNGKASVHDLITQLLANLKLNDADTKRVLDTIQAYAEEKGISVSAMEAIMLPYLLQLTIDSESLGNASIPAVAVAQYLTGVVEKLGIKTEEEAQLLAKRVHQIFAK